MKQQQTLTYFLAPFYCSGQLTHCLEISGNKNNLRRISWDWNRQKLRTTQPQPKITGLIKKKRVPLILCIKTLCVCQVSTGAIPESNRKCSQTDSAKQPSQTEPFPGSCTSRALETQQSSVVTTHRGVAWRTCTNYPARALPGTPVSEHRPCTAGALGILLPGKGNKKLAITSLGPASLSVCKFSLHYPHKTSCLVIRMKQMIIHSNLPKMKDKILPVCLKGNYRDNLGEFSNTSYGVFGAKAYLHLGRDASADASVRTFTPAKQTTQANGAIKCSSFRYSGKKRLDFRLSHTPKL